MDIAPLGHNGLQRYQKCAVGCKSNGDTKLRKGLTMNVPIDMTTRYVPVQEANEPTSFKLPPVQLFIPLPPDQCKAQEAELISDMPAEKAGKQTPYSEVLGINQQATPNTNRLTVPQGGGEKPQTFGK
jgi:hypothetical protein